MIIIFVWVAVLLAALYFYSRQIYSQFSRYGVKSFKPVPFLGNMTRILFRVDHITDDVLRLYNGFPEERFVGRFEFTKSMVMIRDIELVKKIGVKDFEHFLDHRAIFRSGNSLFSRSLIALEGQEWKDMRSTLSPAFTSSKIRLMVPFMVEVGDQMMRSLKKKIEESNAGYIDVECKDLTTRYTNDVIASCAFGLKVDSHNDVDNEFYAMGKMSATLNFRQLLTFFLLIAIPATISKTMIIIFVWVAVLLAALYFYSRQIYSQFSRYGVKSFKPVPFLGNMTRILFRVDHITDDVLRLYNGFPEERFVGRFEFTKSMVMIRDIELVKKIGVKDFEHFLDHRAIFRSGNSLFSRSLIALEGQEWKDMRSTLSPAFTSSKIRLMVPFMVEVGDQMMRSLKKKIEESNAGYIDVECKDLTTRYTNDVIASCAFGLKVDSHNDVDNEFYAMGKMSATLNFRQLLTFFLLIAIPATISKFLKIDFLSKETKIFFRKIVLETMEDREARKIIRPDMIHLLMEAKKGKLTHENIKTDDEAAGFATVVESSVGQKEINRVWSDDDLISQAVLFFIAGFETVSAGMSFLLYELALNPEVQERLVQEIRETHAKNGGKFDFNSIQNMTYMDMVVSELLRKWPPAIALDRVCTKDYNLGKPNEEAEKDYIIRKGTGVSIPVYAIHRDPQFFPNPDKFDPERFSDENKHNIQPFAYLPFGIGPRNCIGSRFALCEVKVMVYQILQHMEISPCERTTIPAKFDKNTFNVKLEGGHWLRFRPRN